VTRLWKKQTSTWGCVGVVLGFGEKESEIENYSKKVRLQIGGFSVVVFFSTHNWRVMTN